MALQPEVIKPNMTSEDLMNILHNTNFSGTGAPPLQNIEKTNIDTEYNYAPMQQCNAVTLSAVFKRNTNTFFCAIKNYTTTFYKLVQNVNNYFFMIIGLKYNKLYLLL